MFKAKKKRIWYTPGRMDEGRKRTILIAASILAARRLADWDGSTLLPRHIAAISDAVRIAERIMTEIDRRWPSKPSGSNWRDTIRQRGSRY